MLPHIGVLSHSEVPPQLNIASVAVSELCGSTATFAPIMPISTFGARAFNCSANSASVGNDGVLV